MLADEEGEDAVGAALAGTSAAAPAAPAAAGAWAAAAAVMLPQQRSQAAQVPLWLLQTVNCTMHAEKLSAQVCESHMLHMPPNQAPGVHPVPHLVRPKLAPEAPHKHLALQLAGADDMRAGQVANHGRLTRNPPHNAAATAAALRLFHLWQAGGMGRRETERGGTLVCHKAAVAGVDARRSCLMHERGQ